MHPLFFDVFLLYLRQRETFVIYSHTSAIHEWLLKRDQVEGRWFGLFGLVFELVQLLLVCFAEKKNKRSKLWVDHQDGHICQQRCREGDFRNGSGTCHLGDEDCSLAQTRLSWFLMCFAALTNLKCISVYLEDCSGTPSFKTAAFQTKSASLANPADKSTVEAMLILCCIKYDLSSPLTLHLFSIQPAAWFTVFVLFSSIFPVALFFPTNTW